MRPYLYYIRYILFTAIVVLTSCSQKQNLSEKQATIPVDLNMAAMPDSSIKKIFRNPSYIILKGTMIGWIERILDWGDRYVIFDRKQNSVYLFDTTGQLIRKVGLVGKGPREYIQLSGCAIDNNKLILYADRPNKLITYDRNGNFLSEENLSNTLCFNKGIAYSGSILYGAQTANRGESGFTITRIEKDGETSEFLAYENWPAAISNGTIMNAVDSGVIWISRPFDNNIYTIDPRSQEPKAKYRLDFGASNMPQGYADGIDDYALIMKAEKENIITHSSRLCQIGHYLLLNANRHYLLINQSDLSVQKLGDIPSSDNITGQLWGYIPIEYQSKRLALQIDPEFTKESIQNKTQASIPVLDSLLSANAEFQNPILLIYEVSQ